MQGDTTIYGGKGNDTARVDGRDPNDDTRNTFNGTTLRWNGGEGADLLEAYFVSSGTTNLDLFGDSGSDLLPNFVTLNCGDFACTILSRGTFLANIHDRDDPDTSLERVNIESDQSIDNLLLYLNEGNNSVHFDDLIATTQVFGSKNSAFSNRFYIGQMFNDERNNENGVSTKDPINTTLTTKGYLSDGCQPDRALSINGGKLNFYTS